MVVSAAKLEANSRNAARSCGPKTEDGKNRSKFNALKHGMRDVERRAVEDAVTYSWLQDRARRAQTDRLTANILDHRVEQEKATEKEVLDLGRRLFTDRMGPVMYYPTVDEHRHVLPTRRPSTSDAGKEFNAATRELESLKPADAAKAREALLRIIARATERLTAKAEAHRERARMEAALAPGILAFDDSPTGERLRRSELATGRGIARSLKSLRKHRREVERNGRQVESGERGVGGELRHDERIGRAVENGAIATSGMDQQALAITDANATNEPTVDWENVTNEPTEVRGNATNEPTDDWRNAMNEPTDDWRNATNEPTDDDRDLRKRRRHRHVDDRPPGKRMEWFQTMAHYKRAEEDNLRKRQERDQKSRDGKGIGTSARSARGSPAGRDA
jgi:hypothetical protein